MHEIQTSYIHYNMEGATLWLKNFGKFLLFTAAVGTAAAAAYYYMQQKDSQLKESSDADDDYD